MTEFTVGAAVVVTDRRDLYAYEEGVIVTSGEPDRHGNVRVHFPTIEGRTQDPGDVRRVWVLALGLLPKIGERRQWNDRTSERARLRGPFVIRSRNDTSEERLFTIYYEATRTHSTASAAELAGFSDLIEEPDGADDGTTAEARAVVERPRNGAATLDTLRDVVLEAALSWEAVSPGPSSSSDAPEWHALTDAIQAYRTARDA